MFADVESLLVAYSATVTGITASSVELPNDVQAHLRFVLVTRLGGSSDYITEHALVDFDVFGVSRAAASDAARALQNALMHLRHTAPGGVLIDDVTITSSPIWVNYQDENVQRYVLSIEIESRVVAQPL
jgi:hypothetical protein